MVKTARGNFHKKKKKKEQSPKNESFAVEENSSHVGQLRSLLSVGSSPACYKVKRFTC